MQGIKGARKEQQNNLGVFRIIYLGIIYSILFGYLHASSCVECRAGYGYIPTKVRGSFGMQQATG